MKVHTVRKNQFGILTYDEFIKLLHKHSDVIAPYVAQERSKALFRHFLNTKH